LKSDQAKLCPSAASRCLVNRFFLRRQTPVNCFCWTSQEGSPLRASHGYPHGDRQPA
jgi:hypothetical protein